MYQSSMNYDYKRVFLFAPLRLLLIIGESVPVWSDNRRPIAAEQQGGSPSFQNAKISDEREVGGVKLAGVRRGVS